MFLRQNTSQIIRFGPCLDIGDGVTEETALTLAQADMRLSKDGGAFAQKSAAGNATHDSDGWYSTTLSTTDTDTVGILKLNVHQPANMFPVWENFYVVEEAVYDAMYGAAAAGPLQATTAGRTLDILATGEVPIDFDTSIGTLAAAQIEASALDGKGDWNVGKTGYSLTQAFPTNFADMSITVATGRMDVGSWLGTAVTTSATSAKPEVDAFSISNDATAADNLEASAETIVPGTAETGTLSTTQMTSNLSEATDDHYIGRTIIWRTGILTGQATDITDYAGTDGLLTFTAVTEPPSNGDTFIII